MQTQMSVTRALVELKTLQDRINREIQSGTFIARLVGQDTYQNVADKIGTVTAVSEKIKGSYQSVEALISRRQKIKSAIILSNANTKVSLMGTEMTVAEAIELKSTVQFRQYYLNTLRTQYSQVTNQIATKNAELEKVIEQLLTTSYGSDKTKIDADTVKAIADPQRKQKQSSALDPVGIEAKIKKLEEEIEVLTSEIDFVLSESNAKTVIVV